MPSPSIRSAAPSSSSSSASSSAVRWRSLPGARQTLKAGGLFAPVSREGGLVLNNLLLCVVLPRGVRRHALSAGARDADRRQDLGGPALFQPHLRPHHPAACCCWCRSGPSWPGSAATCGQAMRRLWHRAGRCRWPWDFSSLSLNVRGPWLAPVGMALGAWLVFGALTEVGQAHRAVQGAALRQPGSASMGLPRAAIGMALAHGGLGIMVVGIIAISLWKVEVIVALKPGETADVARLCGDLHGRDAADRSQLHRPCRPAST